MPFDACDDGGGDGPQLCEKCFKPLELVSCKVVFVCFDCPEPHAVHRDGRALACMSCQVLFPLD